MHYHDHGSWVSTETGWRLPDDWDDYQVVILSDADDRLSAHLRFDYNHGPSGAVQLALQMRTEDDLEFIDRVVEEHLEEIHDHEDVGDVIGQYAL